MLGQFCSVPLKMGKLFVQPPVKKSVSFSHLRTSGKNPFVETDTDYSDFEKEKYESSSTYSKSEKKKKSSCLKILGCVGGDSPFCEDYDTSYIPDEDDDVDQSINAWSTKIDKMKMLALLISFMLILSIYVSVDLHDTKTRIKNLERKISLMERKDGGLGLKNSSSSSMPSPKSFDIQAVIDGINEDIKILEDQLISRIKGLLDEGKQSLGVIEEDKVTPLDGDDVDVKGREVGLPHLPDEIDQMDGDIEVTSSKNDMAGQEVTVSLDSEAEASLELGKENLSGEPKIKDDAEPMDEKEPDIEIQAEVEISRARDLFKKATTLLDEEVNKARKKESTPSNGAEMDCAPCRWWKNFRDSLSQLKSNLIAFVW